MVKIAIARNLPREALIPALEAAQDGGFTHLEITMNSPEAAEQIRTASIHFAGAILIGAGTVTDLERLEAALAAGARFIVTPNLDPAVIRRCHEAGVSVFPGALSPTEVFAAWKAGAALVKVFPVSALGGPSYIKELKGPFDEVGLLACGGVTPENFPTFAAAGAEGIAIGSSLFRSEWIGSRDWDEIRRYAQAFV